MPGALGEGLSEGISLWSNSKGPGMPFPQGCVSPPDTLFFDVCAHTLDSVQEAAKLVVPENVLLGHFLLKSVVGGQNLFYRETGVRTTSQGQY